MEIAGSPRVSLFESDLIAADWPTSCRAIRRQSDLTIDALRIMTAGRSRPSHLHFIARNPCDAPDPPAFSVDECVGGKRALAERPSKAIGYEEPAAHAAARNIRTIANADACENGTAAMWFAQSALAAKAESVVRTLIVNAIVLQAD